MIKFTVRNSGFAPDGFLRLILALVLFGALAVPQGSATTYNFSIPVGTQTNPNPNSMLGALSAAVSNDFFADNPALFAFYDFYIRPQVASDGCLVSTDGCGVSDPHGMNMAPVVAGNTFNLIPDFSVVGATAPAPGCLTPGCTDAYGATPNVAEPFPWAGGAAHFTFLAANNTIALVTSNSNAGGKTYTTNSPFPGGAATEIMPSSAAFSLDLTTSAYNSFQTPAITFQVYALAVQYSNLAATALAAKQIAFVGNFNAVGEAPEPSTLFVAGGGLCLLVLARRRRKVRS